MKCSWLVVLCERLWGREGGMQERQSRMVRLWDAEDQSIWESGNHQGIPPLFWYLFWHPGWQPHLVLLKVSGRVCTEKNMSELVLKLLSISLSSFPFETELCYVAQAGLEQVILLPNLSSTNATVLALFSLRIHILDSGDIAQCSSICLAYLMTAETSSVPR